MQNRKLCLLVGTSGVGKSTVARHLSEAYKYKILPSYTTRPPRYKGESGHLFVDNDEFSAKKPVMCALTEINGYEYGATLNQVEMSDIYIIDENGLEYFTRHYEEMLKEAGKQHHIKDLYVVRLSVNEDVCRTRMIKRGDTKENIDARIAFDKERKKKFYDVTKSPIFKKVFHFKCGNLSSETIAHHIHFMVFKEGQCE